MFKLQVPLVVSCLLVITNARSQTTDITPLFQNQELLSIRLSCSFKDLRKTTADSVYFSSVLSYKNDKGDWDSVEVDVRARGNFRRKHCNFPPMKIKIKKKDAKGTIFEGNKSLKLVLPCQLGDNYNELILKEYLCYKFYEPITPFSFSTRLLDVELGDHGRKNLKTYPVKAFFIEDDKLIAKRFNGMEVDTKTLPLDQLHDTTMLKHDFFEFMIANTDWSNNAQHNNKIILNGQGDYVPIPYDFDMAGFVDAPYATFNEALDIESVRDRIYRGICRDEELTQFVRRFYLEAKPGILKVFDTNASYFTAKKRDDMKRYLEEFFDIMEDDGLFREKILKGCRSN